MASTFSRFNPTPSFPPYPGPYQVGTVDFEAAASDTCGTDSIHEDPLVPTVAFRCFYPCDPPSKPSRPVHWIQSPQRSTLGAYVRFGGVNPTFSNILAFFPRLLYYITLPVHRDAQILSSPNDNKRWPVVVFSHGLGGSRNSYSYICGSLASHGFVVVAPEHRDGSCPITYVRATRDSKAYSIEYEKYPHKPSKEVYEGRDQQLRIRLWEMDNIYEALLKIDAGDSIQNLAGSKSNARKQLDLTAMFRDSLDLHTPGRVTWAGHSFGATTITQFTKSVFYAQQGTHTAIYPHAPPTSVESQITPWSPTMLLDPWALPFNSPATKSLLEQPLPCFDSSNQSGGSTVLAILSEAFANWSDNLNDVKTLLADPLLNSSTSTLSSDPAEHPKRPGVSIFFPEKSAHLSQSDFGILFPRLAKYFAKAEEPERLLRLNVRAMLQILRNVNIPVAESAACNFEAGIDRDSSSSNKLRDTNTMEKGDWEILSHQAGLIRGWVALNADTLSLKAAHNVGAVSDENSLKSEDSASSGNLSIMEPAIGTDQLRT